MMSLSQQSCEACRKDAPLASKTEKQQWLNQLDNWQIVTVNGIEQLHKTYQFKNFVEALAFTNHIGTLAEANAHHPAITTEWGKVSVCWWTHKIKGLHKNDFICAAQTDELSLN
ncbi:4a-hydroxytetrahydrobiopterin dehydratase [Catenovulum sp. 2E275]|uniref:4a-hydroxytetrahydrobiopterin dehydratase n=1 Tax=Catenovulum sp. 2E275 TaxID=2980497 RepID=UPI0021D3EAEB|nr:4a-hydroxytetrahydrobiopterin dehydratase [Catenovulum sp. 2E275]MCU4676732.1 4a-hydroxytetrahydrobiopterin dehydratase [Catenovulum sp. 2E275]